MNRLKKIITCILVIALTMTILNAPMTEQTSVQVAAKNKYTGAVTLSKKEKSEFQKIINETAKKKIAKKLEHKYDNRYTEYTDYAILKVGNKNVLILAGWCLETAGDDYILYYMKDGRMISSEAGGLRCDIFGVNGKDGSLCMGYVMEPYPISSIKINGNHLEEYNIMNSENTKFNGKKITAKKYKKLKKKLYSKVYGIKYVNLRKNKKIKRTCSFVTNKKIDPMSYMTGEEK